MPSRSLPTTALSRTRLPDGLDRLVAAVRRRVEIDRRALAAFRIALGTLLLVDLLRRSRNLTAYYTDDGVLPTEMLFVDYSPVLSLHALSGAAWFQALLFAVTGAFALALALGYRTRVAAACSWLLLVSLHARNPMVLNGGDTLLRLLLLWAMILPLGDRWSLDARRADGERPTVASVGTVAVLGQMLAMYVVNAAHKLAGETWPAGEAIVLAFQADHFTHLLGNALAGEVALLRAATYAWLALVCLSPLLVALTGYRRAALATAFVGAHLGMALTLRIDLFPFVAVAGLLLFYPTAVWDDLAALARRVRAVIPAGNLRWPSPPSPRPMPGGSGGRWRSRCVTALSWLLVAVVLTSNAAAADVVDVSDRADEALEATMTDQSWRMFAPDPVSTAEWVVVPGTLENGTEVDARTGGAVDWDRPPNVDRTYETARERKYVSRVRYTNNRRHRSYYASYLCDRWNADHDVALDSLTIYAMLDSAGPGEAPDVSRSELIAYDCDGPYLQY